MARKTKADKVEVVDKAELSSLELYVAPVEEPAPVKAPKVKAEKPVKRINFSRYMRAKGVKPTHIAGMKARVSNPKRPRTLEEWDLFFKGY